NDQRADIQGATRRREAQGEGDEELAEPQRRTFPERHPRILVVGVTAGEEPVRVAGVVREQSLEVISREVPRIRIEQLACAIGGGTLHWPDSRSDEPDRPAHSGKG